MSWIKRTLFISAVIIIILTVGCKEDVPVVEETTEDASEKVQEVSLFVDDLMADIDSSIAAGEEAPTTTAAPADTEAAAVAVVGQEPVMIQEGGFLGRWLLRGGLIEFYEDGHFEYYMSDAKEPLRCQIGSFAQENYDNDKDGEKDSTLFILSIEQIVVDDIYAVTENRIMPMVLTSVLEEGIAYTAMNMNSMAVSEFRRLGDFEVVEPLSLEGKKEVPMEELEAAFNAAESE